MSDNQSSLAKFKQRLIADLKRDKKRTYLLAALAVVALIMAVRLVLAPSGPSKASAGSAAGPALVQAAPVQQPAPSPSQEAAPKTDRLRRADLGVSRDIFRPNVEFFPLARAIHISGKNDPNSSPLSEDDMAMNALEAHRQAVKSQAMSLSLEGTIVSDRPTAMINGRVLSVGDRVNDFEIVEITSDGCVVAKEGERIKLEKRN